MDWRSILRILKISPSLVLLKIVTLLISLSLVLLKIVTLFILLLNELHALPFYKPLVRVQGVREEVVIKALCYIDSILCWL